MCNEGQHALIEMEKMIKDLQAERDMLDTELCACIRDRNQLSRSFHDMRIERNERQRERNAAIDQRNELKAKCDELLRRLEEVRTALSDTRYFVKQCPAYYHVEANRALDRLSAVLAGEEEK